MTPSICCWKQRLYNSKHQMKGNVGIRRTRVDSKRLATRCPSGHMEGKLVSAGATVEMGMSNFSPNALIDGTFLFMYSTHSTTSDG